MGFDLSICMVAYDGNNIYATPLGAWSVKNSSVIIDTKRRSTSFEYRLRKYQKYGFRLLFPGLSVTIINKFVDNEKNNYDDMMYKISMIMNHHGYMSDGRFGNLYKSNTLITEFQLEENLLPYFKLYNASKTYESFHRPLQGLATANYNNPEIYLQTKLFDHDKIEDRFIEKISDYDCPYTHPMCLPRINSQQLRLDKLNLICSIIKISGNDFNLHNLLLDDINNPNIMFDDENIKNYKNSAEKVRELSILTDDYKINNNFYRLSKLFGKLTPEVVKIQHTNEYYK